MHFKAFLMLTAVFLLVFVADSYIGFSQFLSGGVTKAV
jgi:hypothetical protein